MPISLEGFEIVTRVWTPGCVIVRRSFRAVTGPDRQNDVRC